MHQWTSEVGGRRAWLCIFGDAISPVTATMSPCFFSSFTKLNLSVGELLANTCSKQQKRSRDSKTRKGRVNGEGCKEKQSMFQ